MAELEKNDPMRLRIFCEAYAVAVRCGLITPCLQDEEEMRERFGFKAPPQSVKDDWSLTDGVRKPNTIKSAPGEIEEEVAAAAAGADAEV